MDEVGVLKQIKPETEGVGVVANTEPKSILEPEGLKSYAAATQTRVEQDQKMVEKMRVGINWKPFAIGVGAFFIFVVVAIAVPSFLIYSKAKVVMSDLDGVKLAATEKDLGKLKTSLDKVKVDLASMGKTYNLLGYLKIIPFVGSYWSDGKAFINAGVYGIETGQEAIKAVEPYADVLGFNGGEKATTGEEMVNDRIEFIVKSAGDLAPKAEVIGQKMSLVTKELERVNPERYPKEFKGKKIRENVRKLKDITGQAATAISQSKPLLEVAPYLMGVDDERTYLLLFQNDKELRPTGGFITGYAIAKVNKGKFQPVQSDDIYNLDKRYKPSIPAPDPIINYLKGVYTLNKNLRLRDMNFDPDFRVSMEKFGEEVKKVGVKDIDGIIAVDTQVVVNILDVLGQIGVPGFGNFSTALDSRCNCPQVIYELEDFADQEGAIVWSQDDPTKIIFAPPNYENRKKIVGPLMNSILANAMGQPKEKLPSLFEAMWKSISEKHVLLYMFDETAQAGVEAFNLGGRMKDYDGDYLHINDSNLGGRKSNLYVTQEVVQDVSIKGDGSVEKTVTITYKNTQDYDGWLNSVLPTWTRIYVPKGATLVDIQGFEEKQDPYEELGKTVFAGGFKLRPQGVVKIVVMYKLPNKVKDDYKLMVQKQPGVDAPLYTISIDKQKEELYLKTDREFSFKI